MSPPSLPTPPPSLSSKGNRASFQMSPAPRPAAVKLPISSAALEALHTLTKTTDSATRQRAIRTVLSATVSSDNNAIDYVHRRLLDGMSVSTGATRFNFTLTLVALIRSSPSPTAVATAAAAIYTNPKQFSDSYASAARERALGALAASSAIVSAAADKLSPSAARDVLRVARIPLESSASQWCVAPSAVAIIVRLLAQSTPAVRTALVKPLWAHCTQHPKTDHTLAISLTLLLDHQLVAPSAIQKLYPSIDGTFSEALASTLDRGFSFFDVALLDKEDAVDTLDVVPLSWRLALRYVCAPQETCLMKADLSSFWQDVVMKFLVAAKSPEKKIIALELLIISLEHVNSLSSFNQFFDGNIAALVRTCVETTSARKRSLVLLNKRVSYALQNIARRILENLSSSSRPLQVRQPLIRAFWLWAVRANILRLLFLPNTLKSSLGLLEKEDVTSLFSSAVHEITAPLSVEGGDAVLSPDAISTRRLELTRFLLSLSSVHSSISRDVVRILTLLSIFKVAEGKQGKLKKRATVFDVFTSKAQKDFGGVLPKVVPQLRDDVALNVFKRLADALAKDRDATLVSSCFDAISSVLKNGCGLVGRGANEEAAKILIMSRVGPLIDGLNEESLTGEDKAVQDSLVTMCSHIGIASMEPITVKDDELKSMMVKEFSEEFGSLADRLQECGDSIVAREDADVGESSDSVVKAESIEKVTFLICDLCGRESPRFRTVALRAMEQLALFADDRVVAVLFDAMDTYRSGVERLGDGVVVGKQEESDDDDDDGDGDGDQMDVENDEHDAVEANDEESDDDEDSDDDDASKEKDVREVATNEDDVNMEDVESSEDEVDVDLDADDEDPKVLAEFDRRLGIHMQLLRKQKKQNKQKKHKAQDGLVRVYRLLVVVESIARVLRVRIEKENKSPSNKDGRIRLVFVDVLVRLYEFLFGGELKEKLTSHVMTIVTKQICALSPGAFCAIAIDGGSVSAMIDQLFYAVLNCKEGQRGLDGLKRSEHVGALSKSFGWLISICVKLNDEKDYSKYLGMYEEMVKAMLTANGNHIICVGMFTSFIQRGGDAALQLLKVINAMFDRDDLTKKLRCKGSELLCSLCKAASSQSQTDVDGVGRSENALETFWNDFEAFLRKHIGTETVESEWNPVGISNVLRAISFGLVAPSSFVTFANRDNVRSFVVDSNLIETMKPEKNISQLFLGNLKKSNGKVKKIKGAKAEANGKGEDK